MLGTTPVDAPIGALRGWVAWSTPAPGGGYALTVAHDGTTQTLPIASRTQPFDLDLGTDAHGAVVATFSRCAAHERACALRTVDLATGAERAVGEPRPRSASDTLGSMWRGKVAFARHDAPRHGQVEQLELYDPATHRTRTLPHGDVPHHCSDDHCAFRSAKGAVGGIDLGARAVAYMWTVPPTDPGTTTEEIRVDSLSGRRTTLLATGRAGDCDEPDLAGIDLSRPTVEGTSAVFVQDVVLCYREVASLFEAGLTDPRGRYAPLHAQLLRSLVVDGDAIDALVATRTMQDEVPTCDAPGAPCRVEQLPRPALTQARKHLPPPPYFE